MTKVSDYIQHTNRGYEIIDFVSGELSAVHIDDATNEEDIANGYKMVGITTSNNAGDYKFVTLGSLMMTLMSLYGKDHIKEIVDLMPIYDDIKDEEI